MEYFAMNIKDQFKNSSLNLKTLLTAQLYDILAGSTLSVRSAKTQGNITLPSVCMTTNFGGEGMVQVLLFE